MRARTYDILNAGPRNRFQANGKIVSNSGALVQLHNLTRKSPPGSIDDAARIATTYGYEGVKLLYGDPMGFSSSMLRPCLIPDEGEELYSADLSQIEARMIAALAGEKRVLDVFASGEDVYCHAATGIFGRTITKQLDRERQIGKCSVLALGYQGGPVAYNAMAKNYNLDIASAYDTVRAAASYDQVERAYWGWRRYQGDMKETAYITADLIKQAWRLVNPAIVRFWADLEAAALSTLNTGHPVNVGACTLHFYYHRRRRYLWIRLPNRRMICYHEPRIFQSQTTWGGSRPSVRAFTTDNRTKKWEERTLYGGLLAENITQAAARDVLVEGMLRLNAADYRIVGHVHDEVIMTCPCGAGNPGQISDLMTQRSPWMTWLGLPVGVDVSPPLTRYRK
jgi:DNA polymerase